MVSDGSKMLIPMNILDTCLHKVVTSHLLVRVSSEIYLQTEKHDLLFSYGMLHFP